MARKKIFNLIKQYQGKRFSTDAWYSEQKQELHIWRNKHRTAILCIESEEDAIRFADDFFSKAEAERITLNDYLFYNGMQLTKLEKDVLEVIMGEGSFYEESASYDSEKKEHYVDGSCFIGWDVDENDVPGCRGAISSLVKKGILSVFDDECNGETIQGYCIHQTPIFKKDGYYHELDLAGYVKGE